MNKHTFMFFLIPLLLARPLAASTESAPKKLDTLVVTATRTETELREVGSSITVITADEIESRRAVSVSDVLRGVPGLDVVQSGGLGKQTSVFMRGADSNHTLVLIDGVEMNDPSDPAGAFDFADLLVDDIERIEILRGAQSTLYGSDAIGGVINIITKKGSGAPRYFLQSEGGTYDTFKVGGGVSGGTDLLRYNVNASRLETENFSVADKRLGNSERDPYENTTVAARFGFKPMDALDFDWTLRYQEGDSDLDTCFDAVTFLTCDDPNARSDNESLFTRFQSNLTLFDGLWKQTLGVAYTDVDRDVDDKVDPLNPFSLGKLWFEGKKLKADWQHIVRLHETNILTFGAETEEQWMRSNSVSRKSFNTTGFYLQDQIRLLDRFFTTAGVRVDDQNRIGSRVTWRLAQTINIDETGTRLKGSYGTGFKSPSLFDLFDPIFGNPDLRPEKSRGWDVGVEQNLWAERVLIGATYFQNIFIDLIGFDFDLANLTFRSENIGRAVAEGVESFIEMRPIEDLTLRGNYTYTRTRDDATKERLLRRPTHKGSFDANYRFLGNADVNLHILMVGDREDFPSRAAGYVRVDLAAGYQVNKYLKVFGRVDNLFDKKYQEALGFGATRIAGFAGVRLSYE
ncbi:MAG: TonB-dependent receptor [Pseudomonadota bacterium]